MQVAAALHDLHVPHKQACKQLVLLKNARVQGFKGACKSMVLQILGHTASGATDKHQHALLRSDKEASSVGGRDYCGGLELSLFYTPH